MALFGFAPVTIKPTALVLNILVSVVVSIRFYRAGHFSARLFWPFALSSIPTALLGGYLSLSPPVFNHLLGALLLVAALPMLFRRDSAERPVSAPPLPMALSAGAGVGLVSGLTGVGGGILITPLLLYCRWAQPKPAAALSAVFILVNSVAALIGHLGATRGLPSGLPLFALMTILGGVVGAQLGSVHLPSSAISRVLAVILLIAGLKLTIT